MHDFRPPLWIRSTNLSAPRGTFRPCTRTIGVHEDMQHPGAGAKREKYDGNSISGLDVREVMHTAHVARELN